MQVLTVGGMVSQDSDRFQSVSVNGSSPFEIFLGSVFLRMGAPDFFRSMYFRWASTCAALRSSSEMYFTGRAIASFVFPLVPGILWLLNFLNQFLDAVDSVFFDGLVQQLKNDAAAERFQLVIGEVLSLPAWLGLCFQCRHQFIKQLIRALSLGDVEFVISILHQVFHGKGGDASVSVFGRSMNNFLSVHGRNVCVSKFI